MRGGLIRGTAEHVGGSRIRYRWPCGHTAITDHSRGPVVKRFGEWAARFYVRYWAGTNGVNLPPCRQCARRRSAPTPRVEFRADTDGALVGETPGAPLPNCTRATRDDPAAVHDWQWLSNHTNGAGRWICRRCRLLGPRVE